MHSMCIMNNKKIITIYNILCSTHDLFNPDSINPTNLTIFAIGRRVHLCSLNILNANILRT